MELWSKFTVWIQADNKRKIWDFLWSFLGTLGIYRFLKTTSSIDIETVNGFLFLAILILLKVAYQKRPIKIERKKRSLTRIVTGILAIILVIGGQLDFKGSLDWTAGTLLTILCLGAAIYVPMEFVIDFWTNLKLTRGVKLTTKKRWAIFGIIFFSNFLIFLALFPGIFGWDSNLQAWEFIHERVTQHYSVLLGAVFGVLLKLGQDLFGSYTAGMAIAMFLQMTFISYIYSRIVFTVTEETGNKKILIGTTIFFTLTLIMGMMAVYSTQDVVFGGIFALIFIELYRLAKMPDYWANKLNIAKFILLGFLLCACRNNGVYILTVVFFVMLFIKTGRRRNLVVAAAPILLSLIYTNVGFRVINVPNVDSMREILSVPSQQLARVYVFHQDKMNAEEKEKIEEFYNSEKFQRYRTFTMKADATKGAMNLKNVKENFSGYLMLWAKTGLKNPRTYLEAFLLNSLGTWYPNKKFPDPRANIPYIEFGMSNLKNEGDGRYADMSIERQSLLPGYERILEELFKNDQWQSIPLYANVISMGSYFILFVLICGIIIYKKLWRFTIPLSLVFGSYLILLLAPVAVFRYCYPIIIITPIMLVMTFCKPEREQRERRQGCQRRLHHSTK